MGAAFMAITACGKATVGKVVTMTNLYSLSSSSLERLACCSCLCKKAGRGYMFVFRDEHIISVAPATLPEYQKRKLWDVFLLTYHQESDEFIVLCEVPNLTEQNVVSFIEDVEWMRLDL